MASWNGSKRKSESMEQELRDDPLPAGLALHLGLARNRALASLRQQGMDDPAVAALVVVADAILAKLGDLERHIDSIEERLLRSKF